MHWTGGHGTEQQSRGLVQLDGGPVKGHAPIRLLDDDLDEEHIDCWYNHPYLTGVSSEWRVVHLWPWNLT